jgi:hypothetical protein
MTDSFKHREETLENRFFYKMDQELIQKIREKDEAEHGREKLAQVTGIGDAAVIQELLDNGIRPESLVALSLVPLIFVADADHVLEDKEIDAILDAAIDAGLEPESASHQLLLTWLEREPDPELLEAWRHYIQALCHILPKEQIAQMQEDILTRCRKVANAAGGFLGRGKVSSKEEEMMTHIESAFVVGE